MSEYRGEYVVLWECLVETYMEIMIHISCLMVYADGGCGAKFTSVPRV